MTDVPPKPKDLAAAARAHLLCALRQPVPQYVPSPANLRTMLVGAGTSYFDNLLLGLLILGPAVLGLYFLWWLINVIDAWYKPFLSAFRNPDTYLPVAVPAIGLAMALYVLPKVGALGAQLIVRKRHSLQAGKMPPRARLMLHFYRMLKRLLPLKRQPSTIAKPLHRVGLVEFPSKDRWSVVFISDHPRCRTDWR